MIKISSKIMGGLIAAVFSFGIFSGAATNIASAQVTNGEDSGKGKVAMNSTVSGNAEQSKAEQKTTDAKKDEAKPGAVKKDQDTKKTSFAATTNEGVSKATGNDKQKEENQPGAAKNEPPAKKTGLNAATNTKETVSKGRVAGEENTRNQKEQGKPVVTKNEQQTKMAIPDTNASESGKQGVKQ